MPYLGSMMGSFIFKTFFAFHFFGHGLQLLKIKTPNIIISHKGARIAIVAAFISSGLLGLVCLIFLLTIHHRSNSQVRCVGWPIKYSNTMEGKLLILLDFLTLPLTQFQWELTPGPLPTSKNDKLLEINGTGCKCMDSRKSTTLNNTMNDGWISCFIFRVLVFPHVGSISWYSGINKYNKVTGKPLLFL